MRVLVAYASQHGSTAAIAQRIAEGLRSAGAEVDCRPAAVAGDGSDYDALVVGSAIHNQAWLPEAEAFLRRVAASPSAPPLWTFSVGMPGALPRRLRTWAAREEGVVSAELAPIAHSRGHRLFSGVVRPEHLTARGRIQFRLLGGRYGDFRDWVEIDAWATAVAEDLGRHAHRPLSA